jgi:hypothetical protein
LPKTLLTTYTFICGRMSNVLSKSGLAFVMHQLMSREGKALNQWYKCGEIRIRIASSTLGLGVDGHFCDVVWLSSRWA